MVFISDRGREIARHGAIDQVQQPLVIAFVHREVFEESRACRLSGQDRDDISAQFFQRFRVTRHAFQIVKRIVARMVRPHEVTVFALHTSGQTRQINRVDGFLPEQKRKTQGSVLPSSCPPRVADR